MVNIEWKRVESRCIPNLYVAVDENGKSVGMIDKPVDTRTCKNFWRMYHGVGDDARFLGHAKSKKNAMNHVHWSVCLANATVVDVI